LCDGRIRRRHERIVKKMKMVRNGEEEDEDVAEGRSGFLGGRAVG